MDSRLTKLIADFNTATNDLAEDLAALRARPDATVQEVLDALTPVEARLRALAADPADPIPVEPPAAGEPTGGSGGSGGAFGSGR